LFNKKSSVVVVNIKQANMFNGSYMAARLKQAKMVSRACDGIYTA